MFASPTETQGDLDRRHASQRSKKTCPESRPKFDDNVRTSVTENISLTGVKKVGYAQIPTAAQADVPFDIDNSVTITVDDGAVLVI